ncbi:MAG: LuxR family transcriptional regulator [Mycobacterium sp.]|uniref:LuxR family transcriptional regulator n=1 Tax=Mycobacterium sp. TaxID=1785 RepID=UPI003C544AD4
MLANMNERADIPPVNWSEIGVSELLPTGTVTLLLADIEGSTRLWQAQPDEMAAAVARLDRTLGQLVASHHGVRPIEQGEGDSFVIAFSRAGDGVACAVDLQRAPLSPVRLRIGIHTGDIQFRDEGNYIGPTINRAGRLRDLAHGGQTVLSVATEAMVADNLPNDGWLKDLGTYKLRDLPRPERVLQLCHPDLNNEFPSLRTSKTVAAHKLPVQLTSFIGRAEQLAEMRRILAANRLVTLTGAGGVGKTRLAIEVAALFAEDLDGGAWFVDLAPITDPDMVAIAAARALSLPDQPGRSTTETLLGFVGDRQMLLVLDNCEHLLDATADLIKTLLDACAGLRLLVTSREQIGVAGEVTWRVPSLSLADEAIELFIDRARLARPDFTITDTATAVAEICHRLDGMPLAIELAAARVRALSVDEIRDSLQDRFRLLTGSNRIAVRRQQTLRASVDWSHALLTEPERVLFRRLAVFVGGFDLAAARAVACDGDVERYQVLDQISLLVDKSLVVAETNGGATRYRLLETVRQYALEKLSESGNGDDVRNRHCDHYVAIAGQLDDPADASDEKLVNRVEAEIDNLRAAFGYTLDGGNAEIALRLASTLVPLWLARGRIHESLMGWFDAALAESGGRRGDVAPEVEARALADRALLHTWAVGADSAGWATQGLAIAREIGDPALLARTLTASGVMAAYRGEADSRYFDEAIGLARALRDKWTLSQILGWQTNLGFMRGDPIATREAGEEACQMAAAVGDRFTTLQCRTWLGWAQAITGDLAAGSTQLHEVAIDAEAGNDAVWWAVSMSFYGMAVSHQGDINAARASLDAPMSVIAELGDLWTGNANGVRAIVTLAAGEVSDAEQASAAAWKQLSANPIHQQMYMHLRAEAALALADVVTARRWADEAVSVASGWHRVLAQTTRARVAIAQGQNDQAERDAHEALASAAGLTTLLAVPDIFELLATLAVDASRHPEAARLFGAAQTLRQRMGAVRFKTHDADYVNAVERLRDAFGESEFDAAWAEGAALSTEESIAYAQRGRGERQRPTTGWESLTPAERAVVRLVSEGLPNKDVAARLLISPRTVETHLSHVYSKLGLSSRVQLVQEAARHA